MENAEAPLLKKNKVYYENCPVCKVDQRKDSLEGIPVKELLCCQRMVCSSIHSESLTIILVYEIVVRVFMYYVSYTLSVSLLHICLSLLQTCVSMLMNFLTIVIATGLTVLQNNAVDQHQRGAANGIALTGMSLFRGFGPAIGGVLISWAQKRQDTSFLPGCKVDQRKDTFKGVPIKELFYAWVVALCSSLPVSSLYPFLYFMVRDSHIAKREEDIGYFAGFVGAAYMFGRALTSIMWGVIADRYGRKPVILISAASVVLFNTLFGLSTSFWMAIVTRFLLGSMNGLLGTIVAYASEVCREEHEGLGLSLVSMAWGIAIIIGPAIGGLLAQPAEKFPDLFSQDSVFGRYPYFLPCLCISILMAAVFVACFWLPETLHMNHRNNGEGDDKRHSKSKKSLLKNWPLMSAVMVYSVFLFGEMAYSEAKPKAQAKRLRSDLTNYSDHTSRNSTVDSSKKKRNSTVEIFSLWALSPRKFWGLNFSTDEVGVVLAISGVGVLIFQTFLYPLAERTLGLIMVTRISMVLSVPVLSSYPFIAMLSGTGLSLLLNCASIAKNVLSISIIAGLLVLQNNAVEQHERGAANGISMTGMSLFQAFGPAIGGVLFSWAEKRQDTSFLPGT
ncbi:hypothetical protein IFM89_017315 [Coptis chinensis]|uniref:Major facilitator superfamily (MFS) profile domain-containing protein n=1 Tax=Coptis chinensis TaxID=261450 RepID=A0A835H3K5_9MAGN|nr:hypothetical protein IFM89_017315 [Coptis chinensis]